jgi:mono/diheme cytochrome c family protein
MEAAKVKTVIAVLLCTLAFVSLVYAGASSGKKDPGSAPVVQHSDADTMRVQGEQRFRANCGRCHAAPQKFPPRMMATVLRHMRVRATITDEDMRLVLFYMTE